MIDLTAILDKVQSHLLASGWFDQVNGHEPKSAPHTGGLTAAVWCQNLRPVQSSGLASTSAALILNVRLYTSMTSEPPDAIDPDVLAACNDLIGRFSGDFTLDGSTRCVDLRGMDGTPLSADAGYLNQDGKMFRVMTVTLPLIINDAWDEVA